MKLELINEIDETTKELQKILEDCGVKSFEEIMEVGMGSVLSSPSPEPERASSAKAGEQEWLRGMGSQWKTPPGQDPAARGMGVSRMPETGQIVMKDGKAHIIIDKNNPQYPSAKYTPEDQIPVLNAKTREVDTIGKAELKNYYSTLMGKRVAWLPRK